MSLSLAPAPGYRRVREAVILGEAPPCPLCEEPAVLIEGLRACLCSGAPILMDWPWASRAEYEALYRNDARYHLHEMLESGRAGFWRRDAEYLRVACLRLREYRELYPAAKSLLDMGAGNCAVGALAGAFGFRAVSCEPNEGMVARALSLGRPAVPGDCLTYRGGVWDLVTLHDVLEHVLEPVAALRALMARMGDHAVMVVEMPLLPDAAAEWVGFRHRKPREHPFLYSERAACALFGKAGLAVERTLFPRDASIGKAAYHLRRM